MNGTQILTRYTFAAIAAGVLLTNGCSLPHATLPPAMFGTVAPKNYCPGDTVIASYNLLGADTCVSRPGLDCATIQPTIGISSAPMSFAPASITAFAGRVDFTPTEDNVDVTFSTGSMTGRQVYVYPTIDSTGAAITKSTYVRDSTYSIQKINGDIGTELTHNGMCAGSTPTHAPASLPGFPQYSSILSLHQICNRNSVPINITISSAAAPPVSVNLMPGECRDPSPPGSASTIAAGSTVEVQSLAIDPGAQCNAAQGSTPPATLRTAVVMRCGM
jgi:hypothetical protein